MKDFPGKQVEVSSREYGEQRTSHGNTLLHEIAFEKQGFVELLELFVEEGADLNTKNDVGDNLVFLATVAGRSKQELSQLLKHGGVWNIKNKKEQSVMHYAATGGNLGALELFHSLGADLEAKDIFGQTPFLRCAEADNGFAEMLAWFVENGTNVNATDKDGDNLLHLAAIQNKSILDLEHAVRYGVNWNHANSNGHTIMHYAAAGGNLKALKHFKGLGADIDKRDHLGRTPLLRTLQPKKGFKELLTWFSEEGANMSAADKDGDHLAIFAILAGKSVDELEHLVKCGVNWKAKNNKGQNVLHYAAAFGNLEALKYFRSLGADINDKDVFDRPPLLRILESNKNFVEMFTWFANEGAELNVVDDDGHNLLYFLISRSRSREELELVVNRGVNWNVKNAMGQTLLQYAAVFGNLEALKYFKGLGVDINTKDRFGKPAILRIVEPGKNLLEMFNWFAENGADIHAVDEEGNNLTMVAILGDASKSDLEEFFKRGVKWNVKNEKGQTPVHCAAAKGNLEALKYLKSLGADIDVRSEDTITPLLTSAIAKRNFVEMLAWFVENGADVNAIDLDGDNLLLAATGEGRSVNELKEIVKHGVTWNVRNNLGRTAQHLAVSRGNIEAFKYLRSLDARALPENPN